MKLRTRSLVLQSGFVALAFACGGETEETPDAGATADAALVDAAALDAGPAQDPLVGIGVVELVATLPIPGGGSTPFTEGPVWLAADNKFLFSDIPNTTIHELTLPNTIAEFRRPSGRANGLFVDGDGQLLAAEHEGRRVSATDVAGQVATVTGAFEGMAYHSPNDLVVRADGTIYFTDPPFGNNPAELDFNGLFRIDTAGSVTAEVRYPQAARPNGVGLSPDGNTLYMADTTGVMLSYAVDASGALSGEQTFNDTLVDSADGLAVDVDGNIWVTTFDGIVVFAPDGSHWGTVVVPKQPANCAFGGADGKTLLITSRDSIYRVRVAIPGL